MWNETSMKMIDFLGPQCFRTKSFVNCEVKIPTFLPEIALFDSPPSPEDLEYFHSRHVFVPASGTEPGLDSLVFLRAADDSRMGYHWVAVGFQDKWSEDELQVLDGGAMYSAWIAFLTTMKAAGWQDELLYFCFRVRRRLPNYLTATNDGLDKQRLGVWQNVAALSLNPVSATDTRRRLADWFGPTLYQFASNLNLVSQRREPHVLFQNPRHSLSSDPEKKADIRENLWSSYGKDRSTKP